MLGLKPHGEGWLALPSEFRRKLDLESGDELEVELVEQTTVLRPARATISAKPEKESIAAAAVEASSAPSILAAPTEPEEAASEAAPAPVPAVPSLPPTLKRRGRPPKARSAASLL